MKTLFALLLALVASSSFAVAVPLTPGAGIAGTASGFTTASNFTGQFSAAAFNSNFTTSVGGKAVTMPATMRMAANAGQFAVNAVRLSPAALLGTAVASWLLGYGLQYASEQWMQKNPDVAPTMYGYCSANPGYPSYSISGCVGVYLHYQPSWTYSGATQLDAKTWRLNFQTTGGPQVGYFETVSNNCPAGTSLNNGVCVGQLSPAPESKWQEVQNGQLPDAAAGELASKGVPLPLQVPHIAPQDIPLSDPYVDPVTGKRYRDQARITPSSDAKTADVQSTKQEVDEAGNPKKQEDGQTDKPPEEQTDFCKKNPDASSCKPFDEAPDSELQKKDNPFSLNPVSGFGADNASCPAPQQLFTRGGQQITWDWGKFCTFAQGIRPLIIGFAWLSAIMIVVAVGRRNA